MRDKPGNLLEKSRMQFPGLVSRPGSFSGIFQLKNIRVVASDSAEPGSDGWEHVSVSTATRCPTWEEMCFVKSLFWDDEETVMQLHPPKSQWVNNHPYCLHLWRKIDRDPPMPNPLMVGIKDDGEYKNAAEARAGYRRAVARGDLGGRDNPFPNQKGK